VAGAVQMPSTTFQIANWASAFLWAFVLMTIGGSLGDAVSMVRTKMGF